ncbi:MAG: hypothetical protein GXO90_10985 [FCB group bacterium]|nr:hypothetical protein [FCB group bacterium]
MSDSILWKTVHPVNIDRLAEARVQSHWAIQILSALADACIPVEADDSHTNLGWRADLEALVGRETPDGFHLALKIPFLTISLLDSFGKEFASLPLSGKTIEESLQWVAGVVERFTGRTMEQVPRLRDYEMPDHLVGSGATFDRSDPEAFQELANWFHNSFSLLDDILEWEEDATLARCWPHHFDVGALISMGKPYDFSESIGLGMSPGDSSYSEPYWYINPYPNPEKQPEEELPSGGHWHREGWFGAVLRGSAVWGNPEDQAQHCRQFIDAALKIEKALY